MKKRLFTLLLALVMVFSVLPGFASAAEVRDAAEMEITVPDASAAGRGRVFQTDLFSRLNRLGGLTQTETFAISEAIRNAVCDIIYAGLKNWDSVIDVSEFELTVEDGYACFRRVLDEHLELFYVQSSSFSFADGIMFELYPYYDTTYTKSNVTVFNSLCASIIAGMPEGTDAEKFLYLHDYIVTHCEYDLTYSKRSAYDALVGGRSVCEGYAKAFKLLCDMARLDCEYVSSEALNHAWNVVQVKEDGIDNAHYYIDCTWDDPLNGENTLTAESNCIHTQFLVCKEEFMSTHASNDWINGAGESVYNYTTTEYFRYGKGWWKDLRRPVQWVGSLMCYSKPSDLNHVYFRTSGADSETAVTIPGGVGYWFVWGSSSSYYMPPSYITVAAVDGAFYYSTPTQIYKLTTAGVSTLVYTLTAAQQAKGYLYGLLGGSGELTYYIGQDPDHPSVASGKLTFASVPTVSSITVNKTSATVGEKLTWTATAAGGSGTLRYCFYVYKDGAVVLNTGYGSATTVSYTPTEAGTYKAKVFVKDSAGKSASRLSGNTTVAAAAAPISITGINANKTSATVGEKLTWTAAAAGGSGTLRYCFYVYKDGAVVLNTGYGSATSVSYTPTAAGTYKAKVFVKDSAGKSASRLSGNTTVAAAAAPISITGINADKTSAAVGEKLTWTAAATGGSGTLRYCFYIYKDGAVVQKGSYGTAKTYNYTPTEAGSYKAKVFVKDSAGKSASRLSGAVTVTEAAATLTVTGINPNKTSAATGEEITWTVTTSGGSGTLKYNFYLYQDGVVTYKSGYGSAKSIGYTPSEAGTYAIKVFVKDSAGNTASKLSVNVTAIAPLEITDCRALTTWLFEGENAEWTATAVGGSGTLLYNFYVYRDGTVVLKSGYTSSNTCSYPAFGIGSTYSAKVFVKDGTGKVVSMMCEWPVHVHGA